jgi:hypothetical protein
VRFHRAPLLLLVALGGCQLKRQELPAVYAPYEEGLTLGYEDPSLPTPEAQRESRYQVRVAEGPMNPEQPSLVKLTHSSLRVPPTTYTLRVEAGGVELLGDAGKPLAQVLPKGFPDRVSHWADPARQLHFQVVGPATWSNPAQVKNVHDPLGVWVEVSGPAGRRRILYLRGLGEVESMTWREGQWVVTNRLVDAGMTDAPPPRK